jgi:putative ABC transport system substrate-binding protein
LHPVWRQGASLIHGILLAGLLLPGGSASHAAPPPGKVSRVGFVSPQSPSTAPRGVNAFWDRMRELGYIEGQNLVVESRWAEDRYDRLPALIAEVLQRKVDVLVTVAAVGAVAARNATSTIPIVGVGIADPVRTGLVNSLARPGGNLTGMSMGWGDGMAGKWLELLQETVPKLSTVAVLFNPGNPLVQDLLKDLETIAPARGLKLRLVEVHDPDALDHAFAQASRRAQAVLALPDPMIAAHLQRVTALAAKYRLPAMYYLREFVDAGGLMAYGPDLAVMTRRAAEYVDKILNGARPGDLPIEQPTKFELVVNLKTAKALGIPIPESILLRADEVIR